MQSIQDQESRALEEKNIKTEAELVNLAVCNAPRDIPNWFVNHVSYAEPLKPFARPFRIEVIPDAEARRAAIFISRMLTDAKWTPLGKRELPSDVNFDGVMVSGHMFDLPTVSISAGQQNRTAAQSLIDSLHLNNWHEVKLGVTMGTEPDMPTDALLVRVGLMPAIEYVAPPASSAVEHAFATALQTERDEAMKRTEERAREQVRLGVVTAEQAQRYIDEYRDRNAQITSLLRNGDTCEVIPR
jgi:hypothetical protein